VATGLVRYALTDQEIEHDSWDDEAVLMVVVDSASIWKTDRVQARFMLCNDFCSQSHVSGKLISKEKQPQALFVDRSKL